jgi:hypothetical protein
MEIQRGSINGSREIEERNYLIINLNSYGIRIIKEGSKESIATSDDVGNMKNLHISLLGITKKSYLKSE